MTPQELKLWIDLEDFLTANGYYQRREKWSRKWHVYTNGDETILIINGGDNKYKTYKKTNGDSGSIIDFCINRPELLKGYTGSPSQQAYRLLRDYYYKNHNVPTQHCIDQETPDLIFDPMMYSKAFDKTEELFNYLRSRGITNETLNSPVFENIGIYTHVDKYHNKHVNIGFPLFNIKGELVGAEQQNFGYKKMAAGSDKSNGIWLSNHLPKVSEVIIGEAAVDLLSYHQLFNPDKKEVLYISTSGNMTMNELKNIFSVINRKYTQNQDLKVITAFDNDTEGVMYTNKLLLSLLECKVIFPRSYQKTFQKYTPLTSGRLKSAITDISDFQITDLENYYELIYPFNTPAIQKLNMILLNCIDTVRIKTACPKLKDFNEDLQAASKVKDFSTSKKHKPNNHLNPQIMAKIPQEKFPLDTLQKMGFNVEKLLANEKFCNALAYGERLGPYNINVTDVFEKKQSVPAKIRLVMSGESSRIITEYASAYLDLKKKFWNRSFDEAEQKFLTRYRELGKVIELSINGKTFKGLIGIDDQLNILHFTPLAAIIIHDHYLSQDITSKENLILKNGGMVYKENFVDPDNGEVFNSVLYWSSTKDKVGFHTPTPELLELCRIYYERMNQSLIQSNISHHIETSPVMEQSNQKGQSMDLPF